MLQPDKKSRKDIEKPYLRAANLSWEGALLEDVKSMWFSPEELEKFKLQKGDVLISEGGDVGRSCYWDSDLELYIQNAMTRARLKSKTCFSKYLYYWMYHLKNIGQIDSICNAATIAHFTADKVKETLLLEPPIDEQHRTAAFLDQKNRRDRRSHQQKATPNRPAQRAKSHSYQSGYYQRAEPERPDARTAVWSGLGKCRRIGKSVKPNIYSNFVTSGPRELGGDIGY